MRVFHHRGSEVFSWQVTLGQSVWFMTRISGVIGKFWSYSLAVLGVGWWKALVETWSSCNITKKGYEGMHCVCTQLYLFCLLVVLLFCLIMSDSNYSIFASFQQRSKMIWNINFLERHRFSFFKKKKKWFLFCFLNSDHVFCSVQYFLNVDELARDGCLVCTDLADEVGEGEAMGWGRPVTEGSTAEGLQSQVGQLVVHASPKLKNVQISLSVTGRTTHVEDIVQVFLLVTGGWLRL